MRVLHIVTGMQKASGVTVFVEELTKELRAAGHTVDVLTKGVKGVDGLEYDIVHVHGLWEPWLHKVVAAVGSSATVVWSPHGML